MNDQPHLDDLTLTDYLDNALAPDERAIVEQHLAGCAECAAQVAKFRALFAAFNTLPPLAPERDLTPAIMAAIEAPRRAMVEPSSRAAVRRLAGVLAGQLVAAGVALLLLRQMAVPLVAEIQMGLVAWGLAAQFNGTMLLIQVQQAWDAAFMPFQQVQRFSFSDLTGGLSLPLSTAIGVFLAVAAIWVLGNRWLLLSNGVESGATHNGA